MDGQSAQTSQLAADPESAESVQVLSFQIYCPVQSNTNSGCPVLGGPGLFHRPLPTIKISRPGLESDSTTY